MAPIRITVGGVEVAIDVVEMAADYADRVYSRRANEQVDELHRLRARVAAAGKWTDAVLVAMGRDPSDGDAGDDADEAIREAFEDCRLQREADANSADDLVKAGLYGASREHIARVCADSRAVLLLVQEFLGPLNDALMAHDADGAFVHAQAVNQALGLVASMLNNERPALPRPVVLAVEANDGDFPF